MSEELKALTDKEKQTLRLVLRGYDAKSMARRLDLSVHTVNERLRHARRKLGVSSSREAARILRECEENAPNIFGAKDLGDAGGAPGLQTDANRKPGLFRGWIIGGLSIMSLAAAALAVFLLSPQAGTDNANLIQGARDEAAVSAAADPATLQSARDWLGLVDQGQWPESYAATARLFQTLNTGELWADISEQVRAPLGAVQSRTFVEQESVPTPPHGTEVLRFRTSFENREEATETVSLVREDGAWKVIGYWNG